MKIEAVTGYMGKISEIIIGGIIIGRW